MDLLTSIELWELRKEVVLGSLYVSDYENSKGYNAHELSQFFDGYLEYLEVEMEYTLNSADFDFHALLNIYDNEYNLYEYYGSLEIECLNCLFIKGEI